MSTNLEPSQQLQEINLRKLVAESATKDPYDYQVDLIVKLIAKQKLETEEKRLLKKYFTHINSEMNLHIDPSETVKNRKQLKIVTLPQKKPHDLQHPHSTNVVIDGKCATLSHTNQLESQELQGQQLKLTQIHTLIDRLFMIEYFKQRLRMPKYPKSLDLSDYLLSVPAPAGFDITGVSNIVYNTVYPLTAVTILVFPIEIETTEIVNFVRKTQLSVFLDDALVLANHIHKHNFYRNYIIENIHFIEEGEVEVPSGRLVARGWVINGVAKVTGTGWKFDPLFFFKYIGKNQSVWRQFTHDMILNGELPLNIPRLFDIQPEKPLTNTNIIKIKTKNEVKLPTIKPVTNEVIEEMDKMKHWDNRLFDIEEYKKEILYRNYKPDKRQFVPYFDFSKEGTIKISKTNRSSSIAKSDRKRSMKNRLKGEVSMQEKSAIDQRKSVMQQQNELGENLSSKSPPPLPTQHEEQSVLITSVLNKLQSLAELPSHTKKLKDKAEFTNRKMMRMLGLDSSKDSFRPQRYHHRE